MTLDPSQAGSKEGIIEYLNQAIAAYLPKEMTAAVSVSENDFAPADQGTDGRFKAVVTLNMNGQDVEVSGSSRAAPVPPKTGGTNSIMLYPLQSQEWQREKSDGPIMTA